MNKRILVLMIAFLLAVHVPVAAFAEEMNGTEIVSRSTIGATETKKATESPAAIADDIDHSSKLNEGAPTQGAAPTPDPPQVSDTEEATESTDPTQPTDSTEPTQPTNPTFPTESDNTNIPTSLEIDTENIYKGMGKAYEEGYVPNIQNGSVHLVLPLLCNGKIHDDKIMVSLHLGTTSSSPFEIANYQKSFYLEKITPENGHEQIELFLVEFDVLLSSARVNGVYPISISVSCYDDTGTEINRTFTLYVTITDGKSNEPPKTVVDIPTAEPVVFISNSSIMPNSAIAGENFTLILTLKNSLLNKSVKNMLVTVDTGNLHIELLENTNIFQIDQVEPGGEATLTLHFTTDASIPAGKYTLHFSFSYDSNKTLNLSSSGYAIVEIQQPANMELVTPRFPQSVTVGETIPLSLQVMNMGRDKMYNVRCVVSGHGFAPANTGYIGTMEAGSSAITEVELYIIALNASKGNENSSQYGNTTGTVTLIYEDESGQEMSQELQFETSINRPIVDIPKSQNVTEEEEKATKQWWISVVILGGVICATGTGLLLIRQGFKKRAGKYL